MNPYKEGKMQTLLCKSGKTRLIALSAATLAVLAFGAGSALAISQSGEQKDMKLVGHADLQGRGAYQPNFIKYPDGRIIAFAGLHPSPNLNGVPAGEVKNPLNGNLAEHNGTMIIDITDPKNPVQKFHIKGSAGGTYTMVRLCLGSDLPGGMSGHVYLLRNVQSSNNSVSGYEVWDVTNVSAPVIVGALRGIRSTHKSWWECKTGIAYLPGSKATAPLWRQAQSMVIVDWSHPHDPTYPLYLRTHGLPGGQPSGTGPTPTSLHGAISAHEHPNAAGMLVSGVDVIGNRIYAAWGVGSNGVLQILDRNKLLPSPYGTYSGNIDDPTDAQLLSAQVGRMDMSPDQGGHTSMPVFGLAPKSLQCSGPGPGGVPPAACPVPPAVTLSPPVDVRDIVVLTSEAGNCNSQHWAFIVDVSTENSIGVRQDMWQGPMVLSTLWVNPQSGDKYPRRNYCLRGQRFGTHSVEENFRNPYYGRLTFTAYFNAGIRAWDITDPQGPEAAGFYVPVGPVDRCGKGTETDCSYMTNNVEVDNRGCIIIVDRIGSGMDIVELSGKAKKFGPGQCTGHHDHDD